MTNTRVIATSGAPTVLGCGESYCYISSTQNEIQFFIRYMNTTVTPDHMQHIRKQNFIPRIAMSKINKIGA